MPGFLVSALSVAIYGMFLAIIIPPAKKHRAVFKVVLGAMAISALFAYVPVLNRVSSGFVYYYYNSACSRSGSLFLAFGGWRGGSS